MYIVHHPMLTTTFKHPGMCVQEYCFNSLMRFTCEKMPISVPKLAYLEVFQNVQ
jgi:hypothetical protein